MTKWWGNETEKLRSFLFLVGKLPKPEKLKKLKQKNKIKAKLFFGGCSDVTNSPQTDYASRKIKL